MAQRISEGLPVEVLGGEAGPTVLLLHGWGSSMAHMRPLAELLAPDFRVVMINFPGHGNAPEPAKAWDMDMHADLVEDVIDRNCVGPVLIVGHSNGGRVALYTMGRDAAQQAAASPLDRVRALVLIGPSGTRRKRTATYYLKTWLARALKAPFRVLPSPLADFGLDWLRHSLLWRTLSSSDYASVSGVMRETFVRCVTTYLEEQLPRVSVPTVVLRGAADDAVTAEQVATMVRLLPDAGLVEVEGAGHYVQLDAPQIVASAVREMATRSHMMHP